MNQKTLMIWTIGPVQSFIASARKTVDLWSGSYLLSHLTRIAVDSLSGKKSEANDINVEIIFPETGSLNQHGSPASTGRVDPLPNRLICIVHGGEDVAKRAANVAQQAVEEQLREIVSKSLHYLFHERTADELTAMAQGQVDNTMEFFYAYETLPDLDGNPSALEQTRVRLEQKLNAIKRERSFVPQTQAGLVCSVCGQRDALQRRLQDHAHRSISMMKKSLRDTWNDVKDRSLRESPSSSKVPLFFAGEYLCGVCLTKRVFRGVLTDNPVEQGLKFKSTEDFSDPEDPSKYFAILLMDGDDMGKWLSGEFGSSHETAQPIDHLQSISRRLHTYATQSVTRIVEQHGGDLVYAGGDDVMAFAPIDRVLAMAKDLRVAFSDPDKGLGTGATSSFGIVLSHSHTPLSFLLDQARRLEARAKSYKQVSSSEKTKDALGISLYTRSGESREVILPWTTDRSPLSDDTQGDTVFALEKLADMFRSAQLSTTFIHQLKQELLPLLGRDRTSAKVEFVPGNERESKRAFATELLRLLKRSEQTKLSADLLPELASRLGDIHESAVSTWEFLQLLEMIAFVSKRIAKRGGSSIATQS